MKKDEEQEVNFCSAFAEKIASQQGIENKTRYLLEDFFFDEGWASKTNPNCMKEGYSATLTYNKSTVSHFIEDFTRLIEGEFKIELKKIEEMIRDEYKAAGIKK